MNDIEWADGIRIELFLQAIEEFAMPNCHKRRYINYIDRETNNLSLSGCCTIHYTMSFINKRAL